MKEHSSSVSRLRPLTRQMRLVDGLIHEGLLRRVQIDPIHFRLARFRVLLASLVPDPVVVRAVDFGAGGLDFLVVLFDREPGFAESAELLFDLPPGPRERVPHHEFHERIFDCDFVAKCVDSSEVLRFAEVVGHLRVVLLDQFGQVHDHSHVECDRQFEEEASVRSEPVQTLFRHDLEFEFRRFEP
ncbi:MAG: hypothetical protein AAF368_07640, partial [Planctomycetota bacterium]